LAHHQRLDLAATKVEIGALVGAWYHETFDITGSVEFGVDTGEGNGRQRGDRSNVAVGIPIFIEARDELLSFQAQLRQAERRLESEA